MTPRPDSRRPGFTLLEILLVLVITGILVAAIAAAINIHLRVSEAGRTEVEQAQVARVVLRRIGVDLRAAVPYIEPVESEAGATIADVEAQLAAALGTSGTGGSTASSGGGTSGGSSSGTGNSSSGRSTGGSSTGGTSGSSSSSGGSGVQTLQKLGTLQTLKPQSASSSSGSSSGGSSGGGTSGASGGSSTGSGSASAAKSSSGSSETTEETSTVAKPGIYGDQYSVQVHVSRASRPGVASPSAGLDAPGDVKVVVYYVAPIPGASDATGQPAMGLYRQSWDKAVGDLNASAGISAGAAAQLLADEVAAVEFRYFDGTTWQTGWDSSGGTLPTAVEVAITTLTSVASRSGTITTPQVHRLTVAIPAAQPGSASSSTDTSAESSTSTSSSGTGTTP